MAPRAERTDPHRAVGDKVAGVGVHRCGVDAGDVVLAVHAKEGEHPAGPRSQPPKRGRGRGAAALTAQGAGLPVRSRNPLPVPLLFPSRSLMLLRPVCQSHACFLFGSISRKPGTFLARSRGLKKQNTKQKKKTIWLLRQPDHRRTWCLRCCLQGMAGILKNSMASGAATDGGPGEQADFVDDKSHQRPEQMPSTAVLWENDDPQRAGLRYGPKAAAHLTIRRCVGSPARRIAGGRVDARPAALPSVWAQ